MNIHVHNWLYAYLTGLPFKRNDCSNISSVFHTKLLIILQPFFLVSTLFIACLLFDFPTSQFSNFPIFQPSVGRLYLIVFNQIYLVSIRNSNYLFTEEINNPNDLVLLEKENEWVFAAAERVRASNLTLGRTPDSFMNRSLSEQTDLLQNLLGLKDSAAIDQMLDSQWRTEGPWRPGRRWELAPLPSACQTGKRKDVFPSLFGGVWGGALATNAFGSNREWMEPIVE